MRGNSKYPRFHFQEIPMNTQGGTVAETYVRSVNERDSKSFVELFAEQAIVEDAGRMFHGRDSIRDWSTREIFDAEVKLEVLKTSESAGGVAITTKVDGNFDRTGLPDPVIIRQDFAIQGGKVTK